MDTSWLKAPRSGEPENILAVISQKDVSASIIQAINGICIRRVTDAEARCATADIYIVLPKDWRGAAIQRDIHANVPGIRQVEWQFEPDGPSVHAPRNNLKSPSQIPALRSASRDSSARAACRTDRISSSRPARRASMNSVPGQSRGSS